MGGAPSKKSFFLKKKKKTPLKRAWSDLKGALSNKKRKKGTVLDKMNLNNLKKGKGPHGGGSLSGAKKRFSFDNMKKKLIRSDSPGRKEKEEKGTKEKELRGTKINR